MNEIDSLVDRSERYLKSARLLVEDKDFESAVSRAYYAMFFVVEALLITKDMAFSTHKGALSAFGGQFVKTGIFDKELSKALMRAFELRQAGDYEYARTVTYDAADTVLKDAEHFVAVVSQYIKSLGYESGKQC